MTDSESTQNKASQPQPDDNAERETESTPQEATAPETPSVEDTPVESATPDEVTPTDEASSPEPVEEPAPEAPVASADDTSDDSTADETSEAKTTEDATPDTSGDATSEAEAPADAAPAKPGEDKPRASVKKKARKKKRPPPVHRPEPPPLPPEFKEEALATATARVVTETGGNADATRAALEALRAGKSIPFLGRFRRRVTGGMDERRLRALRDRFEDVLVLEERRIGIRELLKKRGALTDEAAEKLAAAERTSEMEDLAAPYLPVVASRATVARGHGLQPLADAIRAATDEGPLSEIVKPFVPEDAEPTAIDQALAGARDILAEELSLDPALRAEIRQLFRKEGMLTVSLRPERKGDAGRHANLIGFSERALKVPAMKVLSIRRAEKDRTVVTNIEPSEEKALEIVHRHAAAADHPHAGFLRAAAEDGYRRIIKPLLQNEVRLEVKHGADALALQTFERNLRNLLLGPYAGARPTLGIRPDVTGGHRWCAIDAGGDPVGCGQLPHEPTAGREACLDELKQVIKTYDCKAIAVGTTGGRAEAVSLAREASQDFDGIEVAEVMDGGTRALESMGPIEMDERPPVTAECRGALSLARRYQDPLAELVQIDPKALGLGHGIHDVHQGRLRRMFDDAIGSCVAHAGVDPNVANVELLARLPGMNRGAAKAVVAWRDQGGRLTEKAQIAAIEGVGPEVAEEAVGFVRVNDAQDPRDRSQLHPEQYGVAERIAEQVGVDIPTLFSEPRARADAKLDALTNEDTDIHTLRYVLFQATAGTQDPRPRFAEMIAPPETITLDTLTPGLILQGRVIRAAPFGVFVDVGMGTDALIPTPHIGDRPGLDQAAVAPVGAVITARVLEVDPKKKKLTLSMRRDTRPRGGGPRGRGRGQQRGRGPQGRGPQGQGRGPREGAGRGARDGGRRQPRDRVGAGARGQGQGQGRGGQSQGRGGQDRPRRKGKPQKGGKFGGGGGFSIFDRGRGRGDRRGGGGPRNISLKPEDPKGPKDAEIIDESKLTPEELMQRKLDEMKRKLQGEDD